MYFLKTDEAEAKLKRMEDELKRVIEAKESKNKRKRLYSQIAHLKKSLESPENKFIDPTAIKEKREKDKARRIEKKIKKGEMAREEAAANKVDKRCIGCKAYGHVLATCPHNEQMTNHPKSFESTLQTNKDTV